MTRYVEPTEQLVTAMFVRDISRSVEFYRKLGFELVRDDGGFVELAWEGHLLFFNDEFKDELPASPGPLRGNIRVMVPNVDDYWALAQEMGARVVWPIADRSYGLRDFMVADPDGFGVRFATNLSDLDEGRSTLDEARSMRGTGWEGDLDAMRSGDTCSEKSS